MFLWRMLCSARAARVHALRVPAVRARGLRARRALHRRLLRLRGAAHPRHLRGACARTRRYKQKSFLFQRPIPQFYNWASMLYSILVCTEYSAHRMSINVPTIEAYGHERTVKIFFFQNWGGPSANFKKLRGPVCRFLKNWGGAGPPQAPMDGTPMRYGA